MRSWHAGLAAALSLLTIMCGSAHAQTVEYNHTDSLGSPIAVTDAARNVIERSEYAPYGKLLTPSAKDGPGFTGHVLDASTDLSYMQQRYQDPDLGRFLSADPVGAYSNYNSGFNGYSYAANNPYRFNDPDGREAANVTLGLPWTNSGGTLREKSSALIGMAVLLVSAGTGGTAVSALAGDVSQYGVVNAALLNAGAASEITVAGAEAVAGTSIGAVPSAAKLADDALVVSGGSAQGGNSIATLAGRTGPHVSMPNVSGFSVQSANGASLCQLCTNTTHNQVGISTVGAVRLAGGDVVSTPGVSPTHATVTGLSAE